MIGENYLLLVLSRKITATYEISYYDSKQDNCEHKTWIERKQFLFHVFIAINVFQFHAGPKLLKWWRQRCLKKGSVGGVRRRWTRLECSGSAFLCMVRILQST
jgi:hypothetical protein